MWERLKAIGRPIKDRRLTFALVVVFLTIGVVGGLYAINSANKQAGQINPGDHSFVAMSVVEDAAFCSNCHNAIQTELDATVGNVHTNLGPTACAECHVASGTEHVATAGNCTACHSEQVSELNSADEAHNANMGQPVGMESRTCQACHTHADVEVNVTAGPTAIVLEMSG